MTDKTIPFSVLDLAPIPQGSSAREAFTHSLDLAQLAENGMVLSVITAHFVDGQSLILH